MYVFWLFSLQREKLPEIYQPTTCAGQQFFEWFFLSCGLNKVYLEKYISRCVCLHFAALQNVANSTRQPVTQKHQDNGRPQGCTSGNPIRYQLQLQCFLAIFTGYVMIKTLLSCLCCRRRQPGASSDLSEQSKLRRVGSSARNVTSISTNSLPAAGSGNIL